MFRGTIMGPREYMMKVVLPCVAVIAVALLCARLWPYSGCNVNLDFTGKAMLVSSVQQPNTIKVIKMAVAEGYTHVVVVNATTAWGYKNAYAAPCQSADEANQFARDAQRYYHELMVDLTILP